MMPHINKPCRKTDSKAVGFPAGFAARFHAGFPA